MTGRYMFMRRVLAIFLITALVLYGSGRTSLAAPEYSDCLDGWKVDCTWSDYSLNAELNSTGDKEYSQKLIFSYRLENAEHDYAPGSLNVSIPGIGNSYRKGIAEASGLSTDSADSEWDVSWDKNTDIYTFTNRFDVKEGQSVNGGFEVIWELSGREITNGYTQERSPGFSVEGAGSITLQPLSFSCTSQRDRYRLCLTRDSLSSAMSDKADSAHVWYGFKATFEKDWLSRGLNLSDCTITVDTSKAIDTDDIVIRNGSGKALERTSDSGGESSFWLFEKRGGDLGTKRNVLSSNFMVGLPRGSMDGEELTVRVHLDRLYNDEDEWVREAGKSEIVDAEITLTVEDYAFTWNGLKYGTDIWNMLYENYQKYPNFYTYEYEDELTHLEPPVYDDRLCAPNIYDGAVVEFTLRGSSVNDHSPAKAAMFRATPSDAIREDADPDVMNIYALAEEAQGADKEFEEEYEEIVILPLNIATPSDALNLYAEDSGEGNEIPISGSADNVLAARIAEGEEYSMVLGDDILAVYLRDGSIRALEDDEYDFSYVTVTSDREGYSYELYGSVRKDAPFEEYELLAGSDMSTVKRFSLPDGIKALYVKINGISKDFATYINVGVSLHLDRHKEQEKDEGSRTDHGNRLVNFSYFRALCRDEQNGTYNDCKMNESDYAGSYGKVLAEHDMELYGEYLLRDYSNVWLRSAAMKLNAGASARPFVTEDDVSTTRIEASGKLESDAEGELKRFSIYTVLPDGLKADFYSAPVTVTGDLTAKSGEKVAYPEDYVSISQGTYMGHKMLIADFDFSHLPLIAEASNEVSISYPVSLSRADQAMYGDSYTISVYLLPHDEDIDKVTGPSIAGDEYDIDHNGDTTEKMAFAGVRVQTDSGADEWREYAAKYVKSAFSDSYVKDTVTTRCITSDIVKDAAITPYISADDDPENTDPFYEYRLDLGLGASAAENLVFFDRLEQGAKVAQNENDGSYEFLPSAWQGTFISVDTSYAERMGFRAAVYYSMNADEPFDLSSSGWQKTCPHDTSKVRSIAVSLDTSGLPAQMMQPGSFVCVIIKMRAPENEEYTGKTAVNQYTVSYDSYGTNGAFEGTFTLPSAATTLKLLEGVGRIVLQKVDADDVIRTDANGVTHYAPLTGGAFQIYDASENPIFDEPRALNAMGMLVVSDIPLGRYYWEEITAPDGYERIEGKHEFTVEGNNQMITVENHRLPDEKAEAVLTIDKEVNDVYASFGDATFIFRVTRSDGAVYFTSITLTPGILEGSVSLRVEQGYTYTVEEMGVSRYLPDKAEALKNAEAYPENNTVIADLLKNDEAEVKFYNTIEQYEKFSHSAAVVNSVKGAAE